MAAKVAEQLAAQIQVVIDDPIGFTDNEIRGGLGLLNAKGLGPTFLPQMVTQYANQGVAAFDNVRPHQRTSPGAPRPSTTDQRVMAALQLGAEMEAARTGEPVKPVENPFAQLGHPIQPAIEGAWK